MKCELCGQDRQNSLLYGEFLTKSGKGVHTHCLYLSSGLKQNGNDKEGILGFLPSDIAAERKRVSTIRCCYCGKMRANIGCCEKRCYRNFHMICGIDNGAMNQFLSTFRSFCDRHVRKIQTRPKPTANCNICYESLFVESNRFRAVKMIRAPCCKNGWFHKLCLQKFAKSAGYFFKCPLCNDCGKFKAYMSFWGIFVYDKDAEWELVPNAFAELLERPKVCGAEVCHNKGGREQYRAITNPFIYCTTCGSIAVHRNCVPQRGNAFECENCKQILLNADSGRESLSSQQQNDRQIKVVLQNEEEIENVDIEVCGSESEDEPNKKTQEDNTVQDNRRRLLSKHKTVGQIKYDVEDSANEDDEAYGTATAKRQANVTTDPNNEKVELRNTRNYSANATKTYFNCSKTVQLICSDTDSDYSGEEDRQNSRLCETARRATHTITTTSPASCIAQRTRRKSLAFRPPSLEEPVSNSSEDVYGEAGSSYQPSKSYQVFQYDDDDEDGNAGVIEYGSTEKTEDEQEEESIQDQNKAEYIGSSEDEASDDESVHEKEEQQQTTVEIEEPKKDDYINSRNRTTNPLDISCIANRTRRRSSIKMRETSMKSPCHDSAVDLKDEIIIPTTSQHTTKKSYSFIYEEGCEYIEIERSTRCTPLKEDLKSKEEGQLMDYFYHLLSEVKNNSNANNAANTNKNKINVAKSNNISNDPLNINCIANRTRRRSIHTNSINTINEEQTESETNTIVSQRVNSPSVVNVSNSSVSNDWKSINSSSTNESYKSSTYFGRTIKTGNYANSSSEGDITEINDYIRNKRPEAITNKEIAQPAQKRKFVDDTHIPTKKSALLAGDKSPTYTSASPLNCIANRTRRKSVDANKFKQMYKKNEQTPFASPSITATPQSFTSIVTISLIDSSPETSCSNVICVGTPTQETAPTEIPCSPTHFLTQSSTASSNLKRDERLRTRTRRFLNIYDEHDYANPSFRHSPTDSMMHWANLKEKKDAYVMPRYVRVNGKLRRVSTETVLQQQQQANTTRDAQTHFARSYNLLLHATNDNRHRSSSRTKPGA